MEEKKPVYTFEMVWQMFAETDKKIKEISANISELSAEGEKTDRRIKELSKNIGGIGESNGKFAEEAIFNALERDMTFGGIEFDDIGRNWKRNLKKLQLRGEYDVVLENCDIVALIETKYKVEKGDVTELFTKEVADKFRILFPNYKNYKIVLGIGGMSFDDDAIEEAKRNGVGIIKVVGDKVEYHTEGIKIY